MQTKTHKKTNNQNSIGNQTQLLKLKKQIVDGHKTTEQLIKTTKDKARQALEEAILVGHALIEAKKLIPYGGFERWIKNDVKAISLSTAKNYVQLTNQFNNKSQRVGVQSPTNLRKAYIALGIIDDPTNEVETVETNNPTVPVSGKSSVVESHRIVVSPVAPQHRKVITTPSASITKEDVMSRAKYLASELTIELNSKLINNSIVKDDARQILQPLLALLD